MPAKTLTYCTVFLLVALAVGAVGLPPTSPAPARLNVLFIAVDDLNVRLASYGNPVVKTPNIDRLAARGVQFNRAYCQYPLCNPSRTSLLSGRRPATTRVFDNRTPPRAHLKDVVFLPEYFRQQGYFTARVGKVAHGLFEDAVAWDVSEDARRSGARPGAVQPRQRPREGVLPLQWRATDNRDENEPDGRTARRVVQLLEENQGKPFFIAAGFHKPHLPFIAPKKYFDLYPPDRIVLPQEPADDRKDIPPIALTRNRGDEQMTEAQKRQAIAAYYACVSFMDAQVGLLLDALDRLKLSDNTVVVFFGDHGFHLGEHGGLWRKMTLFEESARGPLIVAAPGKRSGVASDRLVEFVDLFPTLTELCGLAAPPGLEGASFVPLLEDPHRSWKKAASTEVLHQGTHGRSVRTERYRYTEWGNEKTAELYDHQADPREYTNLVSHPGHAQALGEAKRLLREGGRAARPNILFILADDLGYADTGAFSQTSAGRWLRRTSAGSGRSKRILIPNLDRLAAQGRRMTQYYSGAVVCAPSRALLLTGRYTIHSGVTANTHDLPESETTIAEALRARGYATACIGKWHRGRTPDWVHPNRHGFDYFFGFVDATEAHEYYPKVFWENAETQPNTGYATDRFTEKALQFIRDNKDRPFFLYLAYTAPHYKIQAPAEALARYQGLFQEKDPAQPLNASYAAMVSRMDEGIGRVFDLLRDLRLEQNTLVVFSSDHGATFEPGNQGTSAYHDSNYPFRGGKRTLNEGGIRVPLIARWPGRIPAGNSTAEVGHAVDLFPTFMAAAGSPADPGQLDGVSLLDEWTSGARLSERPLFWEWRQERSNALAVRLGDWKLLQQGDLVELYDLGTDLAERRNLAAAHRDVVARLQKLLQSWLEGEVKSAPAKNR